MRYTSGMKFKCLACQIEFERPNKDVNRGRTKYCSRICSDEWKKVLAKKHADYILSVGRKQCKACGITRSLNSFPLSTKSYTGYHSYCLECRTEINRAADKKRWSAKRAELTRQRRAAHLRREFGIGIDEYEQLLHLQGGVCKICGGIDAQKVLAVDHCHSTGSIRGLLCENCNRGLGMYKDDISLLMKAVEYLQNNSV